MPEKTRFTVRDDPEANRFEAVDGTGVVAAVAVYQRLEDRVVFVHTEVDDAFEGQGVGSLLVRHALDSVRGEGLRVVAQCPFVKAWIERHPEYADLTH